MSDDTLALGQREITEGIEFTQEELDLMAANACTPEEIKAFVAETGVQTLNAAIGGLHGKRERDAAVAADMAAGAAEAEAGTDDPATPSAETSQESPETTPPTVEEQKPEESPQGEAPAPPATE